MLWRACRGNVFLRQAVIETPLEDPANVRNYHNIKRKSLFTNNKNSILG
jgi:hypothetical protein